jgi:hypothetical protein
MAERRQEMHENTGTDTGRETIVMNEGSTASARSVVRRRRRSVGVVTILAVALGVGSWSLTRAGAEPGSDAPAGADTTKSRIEACMRERGVAVVLAPDDPMVLTAGEVAARYGYGISIPIAVRRGAPDTERVAPDDDLGACADEARPEGAGDRLQAAYGRLAATISADDAKHMNDIDQVVATLPGVDEALAGWRTCVAPSGYDVADPGAARASIAASFAALPESARTESPGLTAVQSAERDLAVADITCRETHLFPGLIKAIDAYVGSR